MTRVRGLVAGALAALLAGCVAPARPLACAPGASGATGDATTEWTRVLDGLPSALVADEHGIVVTAGERFVVALDDEGGERWQADVPGAGLDWPVLAADLVVVPTNPEGGARCTALDRATGARRWEHRFETGRAAMAAMATDRVVCASTTGLLAAVDRGSGAVRWSADLGSRLPRHGPITFSSRSALAIDEETGSVAVVAAVGPQFALFLFDLATGAERGLFALGQTGPPSAVTRIEPASLFVASGDHDGRPALTTFDLDDRSSMIHGLGGEAFDPASVPAVGQGLVVVVDRAGGLLALELASRRLRWQTPLGGPVLDAKPVVTAQGVAVADGDRRLRRFGLTDGREIDGPVRTGVVAVAERPGGGGLVTASRDPRAPGVATASFGASEAMVGLREPGGRPLHCPTEPGRSSRNEARPLPQGGDRPRSSGRRPRGRKQNRGRRGRGRRDHEATVGGRSPLRPSDPTLESEDASIHLR